MRYFAPKLAALLSVVVLFASPARAGMAEDAEDFVRKTVEHGISILGDGADSTELPEFRQFVLDSTARRKAALFALGNFRRNAEPADLDAYVDAVTEYAVANYETRLSKYNGQTVEVGDAVVKSEDDAVVPAKIINKNGEAVADAMVRVVRTDEGLKIFDIQVEGIWLAVEQRNQFAAFLSQNGGSVPKLTAHLEEQTKSLRASGELPQG